VAFCDKATKIATIGLLSHNYAANAQFFWRGNYGETAM
jgi:hypothetical protein